MPLYTLDGITPEVAEGAYIAPTAVLIGRIRIAAGASVWWNAVLRGDNEWIMLGERSNFQDGVICHTDMGSPLNVGTDVTVGHGAILHGCTVEDGALIGMGATVLNDAVIGAQSIVGAGALVGGGKKIPARSLAVGMPAKVARSLTDEEVARTAAGSERYVENGQRYADRCILA